MKVALAVSVMVTPYALSAGYACVATSDDMSLSRNHEAFHQRVERHFGRLTTLQGEFTRDRIKGPGVAWVMLYLKKNLG
ncbi:MAG: hypothetical protein V6Z86_05050 [Hyphomicrobiales bacterium]